MATSKVTGKTAGTTARKRSSTKSGAAARKPARTTRKQGSAPVQPALQLASAQTSAYGRAFWSRTGILSALALGILILVQVNADRPVETASSHYRSGTTSPDQTLQFNRSYAYPPAGYNWQPAQVYHAPATPPPVYGYHPYYGPWSPAGTRHAPGDRQYDDKG